MDDLDDLRKRAAADGLLGDPWAARCVFLIDRLREETGEYDRILTRQSELLTGVANALKGDPPTLTIWDHSDLPEVAQRVVAELHGLRGG